MKKLQEIIEYIDHINAHPSRVCDKGWLQKELSNLEKEIYNLVTEQQEEIKRLENELTKAGISAVNR